MNKATVSLWFRIPSATAARVAAKSGGKFGVPVLDGVVPLFMFGSQVTSAIYGVSVYQIILQDSQGNDFVAGQGGSVVGPTNMLMQPSCIGVQCNPNGTASLVVHIQTADRANATNTVVYLTNLSKELQGGEWDGLLLSEYADYSSIVTGCELQHIGNSGVSGVGQPPVSLNKWHHVLVSWDLGSGNSTFGAENPIGRPTSSFVVDYSRLWCALDTGNKSKFDLPAQWIGDNEGDAVDPNACLTQTCYAIAGTRGASENTPRIEDAATYIGDPTCQVSFGTIPASPMFIPGPVTLSSFDGDVNPACEDVIMAELQVFPGVTLDTGDSANVGLFVTSLGKPQDMAVAAAALGTPLIALKGVKNWQGGINTGSGGDLTQLGTISKFTPGPGLGA